MPNLLNFSKFLRVRLVLSLHYVQKRHYVEEKMENFLIMWSEHSVLLAQQPAILVPIKVFRPTF